MTNLKFRHIYSKIIIEGDFLKEYKKYLEKVRSHLKDKTMELNNETLDKLVNKELQKPADEEMDKTLIDLCLNALVAYRAYTSDIKEKM